MFSLVIRHVLMPCKSRSRSHSDKSRSDTPEDKRETKTGKEREREKERERYEEQAHNARLGEFLLGMRKILVMTPRGIWGPPRI